MKPLPVIYSIFALAGLLTAIYFGLPYWLSPNASLSGFMELANSTAPGATLSTDLAIVYVLVNVWIVVEGRRQQMRHLWGYLLANTVIAVAFGLPLFLLMRERRLQTRDTGSPIS